MRRILGLVCVVCVLVGCEGPPAPSPPFDTPLPTITETTPLPTVTTLPTVTVLPTKTSTFAPTATLLFEPIEGPSYREIARHDLKSRIVQSALSPDGSMLAALTWDGVYLYDSDTLELRWRQQRPVGIVTSVAWTADNELLFIPDYPPYYLFDHEDGSTLKEINNEINNGAFFRSPNGKYFATYNSANDFSIYDTGTLELLLSLSDSYNRNALAWMPDGEHVIFFPKEGFIEIWNVKSGEIVQKLENQYEWFEVHSAGFSSDGHYFACIASMYDPQRDKQLLYRVMAWDLLAGEPLTTDRLDGSPSDHGWRHNEHTFTLDNGIVIQVNGSSAEMTMLYESAVYAEKVFRYQDGWLAVLIDAILRYDNDFNLIDATIGHTSVGVSNTNKTLSPDGQMLAIGAATRFYVWDIARNELVTAVTDLAGYDGGHAAWSPDGKTLVISNHIKRQISLWDSNTRSIQKVIDASYHICSVAWMDKATLALALTEEEASISEGGCVMQFLAILDIETEQIIYREQRYAHFLSFISLNDQQHIAFHQWSNLEAADVTSTLVIWDFHTHQRLRTIPIEKRARVYPLQHAPGVVIAETGLFRMIDFDTGKERTIKLNTTRPPSYEFYLLGDYVLEYDIDNLEIRWYDHDGILLETDAMEFGGYLAEDPIITDDGRIFDVVNPYMGEYPGVALIELFPPEK